MIVCHCQAVSDRVIRTAVRNGARTRTEIVAACAVNLGCGGCAPAIDEIIEAEIERDSVRGLGVSSELAVVS